MLFLVYVVMYVIAMVFRNLFRWRKDQDEGRDEAYSTKWVIIEVLLALGLLFIITIWNLIVVAEYIRYSKYGHIKRDKDWER